MCDTPLSLIALARSLKQFLAPDSVRLRKGWNRWLAMVQPQIEMGPPIAVVEDMIQGDLRFCVAREESECKGGDRLA